MTSKIRAVSRAAAKIAIVTGVQVLALVGAAAGPCTARISLFEATVQRSAGQPDTGPMAPQWVGAQMDRQPTPISVARAEMSADARFRAALARAKRLDARGDRAGCTRALVHAQRLYNL